jgi:hypothetical protein
VRLPFESPVSSSAYRRYPPAIVVAVVGGKLDGLVDDVEAPVVVYETLLCGDLAEDL